MSGAWSRIFAIVAIASALSFGQDDAAFAQTRPAPSAQQHADLIQRGAQLFEDQQYQESIQALSAALVRPNNTREQKIEIYRLLAFNYVTLNRKEEGESAVRGLLSLEPDYELPKRESPRFRDFFAAVKQKWESEGRPGLVKPAEPPPAPVTLIHTSPSEAQPNQAVTLATRVDDPQARVAEVRLDYRTGSHGHFLETPATLDHGTARATIPGSAVKPPIIEYYFIALDKNGLPIAGRGDSEAPLRIAVPEGSKGWVLPVAIGAGVLGAAAIIGGLALAGVFKSGSSAPKSTVTVTATGQ